MSEQPNTWTNGGVVNVTSVRLDVTSVRESEEKIFYNCCIYLLFILAQLIWTMHNICKVGVQFPTHQKKNTLESIYFIKDEAR